MRRFANPIPNLIPRDMEGKWKYLVVCIIGALAYPSAALWADSNDTTLQVGFWRYMSIFSALAVGVFIWMSRPEGIIRDWCRNGVVLAANTSALLYLTKVFEGQELARAFVGASGVSFIVMCLWHFADKRMIRQPVSRKASAREAQLLAEMARQDALRRGQQQSASAPQMARPSQPAGPVAGQQMRPSQPAHTATQQQPVRPSQPGQAAMPPQVRTA